MIPSATASLRYPLSAPVLMSSKARTAILGMSLERTGVAGLSVTALAVGAAGCVAGSQGRHQAAIRPMAMRMAPMAEAGMRHERRYLLALMGFARVAGSRMT